MPTEEQLLEIHRLALLGAEPEIARNVTGRLASSWLGLSRFREVRELCTKTLDLEQDPPVPLHTWHRLSGCSEMWMRP
jgi:hypothetical protein